MYIQLRNATIFYSFDTLDGNTNFQLTMEQSVEHAIAARTVPSLSLGHSLFLGQNLGTCVS